MKTLNRDIERWAKVCPVTVAKDASPAAIRFLLEDAKHDIATLAAECEALRAELAALKAKPARVKVPSRTPKARPSPLPNPGRFTMKCPDESWVRVQARQLGAPVYEDGPSSPELTRAYVAQFETMNRLKPTTGGEDGQG